MEEEYVPLSQASDLLLQQKEMFMGLIQQQSDNFRGFVKDIMDTTNTRLDALSRELHDIKTSLQYTQKEVDEVKNSNAQQTERCSATQTDL